MKLLKLKYLIGLFVAFAFLFTACAPTQTTQESKINFQWEGPVYKLYIETSNESQVREITNSDLYAVAVEAVLEHPVFSQGFDIVDDKTQCDYLLRIRLLKGVIRDDVAGFLVVAAKQKVAEAVVNTELVSCKSGRSVASFAVTGRSDFTSAFVVSGLGGYASKSQLGIEQKVMIGALKKAIKVALNKISRLAFKAYMKQQ